MPEYQGGYRGSQPTYMPPAVGVNLLLYLQDMDITTGPLRKSKRTWRQWRESAGACTPQETLGHSLAQPVPASG